MTDEYVGAVSRDLAVGGIRAPKLRLTGASWQLSTLSVVLAMGAWWLLSYSGLIAPLYLPGPIAVLRRFVALARDGYMDATLWEHFQASVLRVLVALVLALITAVPLGIALGMSRITRALIDPLIEFCRPVPPLAYLPLIVIWFGIGELSKVLLIYLAIFAPVVVASLTGIRIALGAGWSTLVAAELIAATRGLGFMIQSASQFLATDVVIAGILVIAGVASAFELGLRYLQRRLSPWQGRIG